nr:MAG TPA: hypothetical protein [Caudoviricetes sp.]
MHRGGAIRHFRRIMEAHKGRVGICKGAGLHWSEILRGVRT